MLLILTYHCFSRKVTRGLPMQSVACQFSLCYVQALDNGGSHKWSRFPIFWHPQTFLVIFLLPAYTKRVSHVCEKKILPRTSRKRKLRRILSPPSCAHFFLSPVKSSLWIYRRCCSLCVYRHWREGAMILRGKRGRRGQKNRDCSLLSSPFISHVSKKKGRFMSIVWSWALHFCCRLGADRWAP